MYVGCLLAAFMQQSADCDQCFMMHVCMQGNSTASANAVSMALSQGGPATAISQAVAQVVRSHLPAADLPVVADGFLDTNSQLSPLMLTKFVVMQTGSSVPAPQVLFLWNSPMHGRVIHSHSTLFCCVCSTTQDCLVTCLLCCYTLTEACNA